MLLPTKTVEAKLLAAVTLQGNTFVTFNHAIRPRFDWSQDPQRVRILAADRASLTSSLPAATPIPL